MASVLGRTVALPARATDPAGGVDGDLYFNTTTLKVRMFAAGVWVDWA